MMMSFLGKPGNYGESFLFNGGIATLASYGLREDDLDNAAERLPAAYGFHGAAPVSYLRPPYLFVHAVFMPSGNSKSSNRDMLWIRQEFHLQSASNRATVCLAYADARRDDRFAVTNSESIQAGVRRQADCVESTRACCTSCSAGTRGKTRISRWRSASASRGSGLSRAIATHI